MRKDNWASAGTVLSAVAGTACCWLPVLFILLGATSAAASVTGFVAQYHVLFVVVAVLVLTAAGYLVYFYKGSGEC